MKCDEAEEFVSAIYDGEAVPPEAAEHFAHCVACQELLRGFVEMGAELRRFGNLQNAMPVPHQKWVQPKRSIKQWWEKGWQMMKVPRIAFASLLLLLLLLGSRLALVEVRAHEDGPVLLLQIALGDGNDIACSLSTTDERLQQCSGIIGAAGGSNVGYLIKFLKKDGDRALLSLRSSAGAEVAPMSTKQASALSETKLWVETSKASDASLGGVLEVKLTAHWTDHIPITMGNNEYIDPLVNQLRIATPLILKNNQVVGDLQGAMAFASTLKESVFVYIPGEGRFTMSLTPITGSVAGKIDMNRISFTTDGRTYVVVTGAPVARGPTVWVKLDQSYTPPGSMHGGAFLGAAPVGDL